MEARSSHERRMEKGGIGRIDTSTGPWVSSRQWPLRGPSYSSTNRRKPRRRGQELSKGAPAGAWGRPVQPRGTRPAPGRGQVLISTLHEVACQCDLWSWCESCFPVNALGAWV